MPERSRPAAPYTPAPLATRLAAFLLDCAVGFGLALLTTLVAWLWLLWQSNGGSRQPSDGAIYLALIIGTLWLPAWAVLTLLAWEHDGQSIGLAATALCVCDDLGRPPSSRRGLLRLLLLSAGAAALGLAPLLLAIAAAAAWQGTLPPLVAIAVGVVVLLGVADALCCALTAERRALHDLASGTRVVNAR